MAQDTSAYQDVLKDFYGPGIVELLPKKVPTLNDFEEKNAKDFGGNGVVFPIHVGRNSGAGWGTEGGALPAAGKQQYATVRIPMRYGYGRISTTAQVMELSQTSKGAFAPAWEQETKGMINDLANQRGRMIYGDGRGVLALVNGTATSVTQTLDSPGGVQGALNGTRFISVGDVVGTINATTGAVVATTVATVATVASTGLTMTLDASKTWTDNNFVVKFSSTSATDASDTSYAKEPSGLLALNDDGTYVPTLNGVNRTTYPLYGSYVIPTAGAWSSDLIQRGIDIADQRGNGSIKKLYMHHSARRAYLASMEDSRRYITGDLMSPDGGTKAAKMGQLAFGSIPVQEDKYCQYGMVHGIDTDTLERYVMKSGEWISEGNNIMFLVGTGSTLTHVYEAVYTIWDNFHISQPNNCFRADGLSVNAVVVHVD